MKAVEHINKLSTYLIAIIGVGGGFSCLLQTLKWIMAEDEMDVAKSKKNIKIILIAVAVGLSITGLINQIFSILG